MMLVNLLCLWLQIVTPSPGWSTPIIVTDSCNSDRPKAFLHIDCQDRFHLVWAGMNDQDSIGYKAFSLDGTVAFSEALMSRPGAHSVYLTTMITGDSLYAFWREISPIYYSVRSLTDGSEIVPATYLFTTSTLYPYIRACPDSLGRLHVLYNKGSDVTYSVWTPAPGSGFITEREWKIEGASAGGVLLVDGNRVHIVVQDPDQHDYSYLQYDLDGNTIVPLTDFTPGGNINCSRDPRLSVDSYGNLLVVEDLDADYVLWKLDKFTGFLIIDQKVIVSDDPPRMYISVNFIFEQIPGTDLFYLVWTDNGQDNQILFLLMDENGNVIVDWALAYDYADEDPEALPYISGVTDSEGNLYIAYEQIATELIQGYYPTFGWFDYDFVSLLQENAFVEPVGSISFSCNPVEGSVTVYTNSASQVLRVFDIAGREISSIMIFDGVGIWSGQSFAGERLPAGIYNIVEGSGIISRITLLNQ